MAKEQYQRQPKIQDLIGKKVKITYYRRNIDSVSAEKTCFDIDVVVEGILEYFTHHSTDKFHFNGPTSVCACVRDDEGNLHFKFLPLDGALSFEGSITYTPSKFDGKKNGSYTIESLET